MATKIFSLHFTGYMVVSKTSAKKGGLQKDENSFNSTSSSKQSSQHFLNPQLSQVILLKKARS